VNGDGSSKLTRPSNGMEANGSGHDSLNLLDESLINASKVKVSSNLATYKPEPDEKRNVGSGQYYENFPQLPPIKDPEIAEVPFTHRGSSLAMKSDGEMNYERFEFLGDAYLYLISTRIIIPRFPDFSAGRLSQTRQQMTNNETLAEFSLRYGFNKRAHLPRGVTSKQAASGDKTWTKVMGDMFEAYVAAVITSDPENGYEVAEKWLRELWEPLLSSRVDTHVPDAMAKQLLATKVTTRGCKIKYEETLPPKSANDVKSKLIFTFGAFYSGLGYERLLLGTGTGPSKAEAGYDAAVKALGHPQLKTIMAKKKDFDSKTPEEKEQIIAAERSTNG
ncbi:MAG: hypothetical protein Q9183_004472, partial [Haloplaca sp. 2 TL-2023]